MHGETIKKNLWPYIYLDYTEWQRYLFHLKSLQNALLVFFDDRKLKSKKLRHLVSLYSYELLLKSNK